MHGPVLQLRFIPFNNDRVVMQTEMDDWVMMAIWPSNACALGSEIVHVEALVHWRGIDIPSLAILLSPISDVAELAYQGVGAGTAWG
jgi:hypothetical protein